MTTYRLIFLFTPLLCYATAWSQYDPDKVNRKAIQLYTKALQQAVDGDVPAGIAILQQAIGIDPNYEEAFISMAGMYGEQKNYPKAVETYQKAKAIDSIFFLDYNLPYSMDLAGMGEFEKALQAVNAFLTIPNLTETSRKAGEYRQGTYRFALDYAAAHPLAGYKFEPRNLGDSINTDVYEYYPSVSLDGDTLFFTRRVNNTNEDLYYSHRLPDGTWSKAHGLPGDINTNENEAAQTVSIDGQLMVLDICNREGGYGGCDLYISYQTPDGWSTPENLGDNINTEFREAGPSISPDKKDLYFSSNRPGGYGGFDLYVSHHLPNGHWSAAENMGPVLNTVGDESTPFIHVDNQTLYFNSNGHPGYGNDDLFVSRRQPDGSWGKPENLGYPINTIDDEGTLVIASDGKTAYYSSDRAGGKGGYDIYTFEMREDIRPAQTRWVKGRVFDRKTGKGLPSGVLLTDLSTGQVISRLQTDETGNYIITLPKGKDYAFNVNRRGYLFYSENFALSKEEGDSAFHIDIPLQPIEANAAIVLRNIFFDPNKFELRPESEAELKQVVQLLKDNPGVHIQISGHTDNSGRPAENQTLSENRARSVTNFLIASGIATGRLSFKGFGDTKPVADNAMPEGRAKNRRTELTVISLQ
jgi:outer membrane protein OmpA-like peptidoglycan-associated protein/tetratricopeptide (TPR) repeat protein